MGKSYTQQIKAIKEDVRDTCNKITRDLAKEASKDMHGAFKSIIDQYYDSYNPHIYARTHNLYNMFVSDKLVRTDNGHMASVLMNPFYMFDNYDVPEKVLTTYGYPSSSYVIYDLVWNHGNRGLPNQKLDPKWRPTLNYEGANYDATAPHYLMSRFINQDWYFIGKKKIDKIGDKYCSNVVKEFM